MPKKWSEVASSPEYQALAPDQQELARSQYFDQVVAPQIGDQSQLQAARQQFDAQTRAAPKAAPSANSSAFASLITGQKPAEKGFLRTTAENLLGQTGANVLDSLQHHAMGPLHGAAQLVEHGVNAAANAALPEGSALRQYVNQTVASDDAALKRREADYQARVPDGAAAGVGSVVGEVAPWMYGMGQLRAAGLLPKLAPVSQVSGAGGVLANLAAKAGLLSAEGAAMGAAQPVVGEGDYGAQKGSQVAVGAAAAPVVGGAVNGLVGGTSVLAKYATAGGRDALAAEKLAQLYGADPGVIAKLRAQSQVPGFQPTAAQAIGTPEAVQAERVLRNNSLTAPAFAERESQNNFALRDAVAKLAGTDADMAAARQARAAATDPYYASLPGNQVPIANVLAELDALSNSSLGVRPNIKAAVSGLRKELIDRAGGGKTVDASILSGIRENVHSFLGERPSAQEKKALAPIANYIADEIDAYVPGYRANLAAYAQGSQPLSDMEAGRRVLDAIDSGRRDAGGNQAVDLTKLRAALARDDKAKFGMSPQARSTIEGLLSAAQQRSITDNTIAASGPGTAADVMRGQSPVMQRILGQVAGATGAGLGSFGGPGGSILGYLAATGAAEGIQGARNSVIRRVGQKGASAQETANALEAYLRQQQGQQAIPYWAPSALLPYSPTP